MEIELNESDIAVANLFEKITGVMPIDWVEIDNTLFFVVPFKTITRTIGKEGANIKLLEKKLGKKIFVFGNSNNIKQFAKNLFNNVKIYQVDEVDVMGKKAVTIVAEEKDRKKILGKEGLRIKGAKALMERLFNASLHVKTKRVV